MKMKETYEYKGYTMTFEYNKNRKHSEYTAKCWVNTEQIVKSDESFEGVKNRMKNYIDNIPAYRLMYDDK